MAFDAVVSNQCVEGHKFKSHWENLEKIFCVACGTYFHLCHNLSECNIFLLDVRSSFKSNQRNEIVSLTTKLNLYSQEAERQNRRRPRWKARSSTSSFMG